MSSASRSAALVLSSRASESSGIASPNRAASIRTASGNATFSCSSTNLITSPPVLHPKQWKNAFSRLTWNDGVFSLWNGHSPFHVAPVFFSDTTSPTTDTMSAWRRRSSMKERGK